MNTEDLVVVEEEVTELLEVELIQRLALMVVKRLMLVVIDKNTQRLLITLIKVTVVCLATVKKAVEEMLIEGNKNIIHALIIISRAIIKEITADTKEITITKI